MKKYIIPIVAFVLITGAVNAQTAVKKTDNTVAKMSKPVAKKMPTATTASVTPSAPATASKKTDVAGIKRKQHKKSKSVKPVSK